MNTENESGFDSSRHLGPEDEPEKVTGGQPQTEPETEPETEVEQPKVDLLAMVGSLAEGYVAKNFGNAFLLNDQERHQWEIIKGALAEKYGEGGINIPPELALLGFGAEIGVSRYFLFLKLQEARAAARKQQRIELGGKPDSQAKEGGDSGAES